MAMNTIKKYLFILITLLLTHAVNAYEYETVSVYCDADFKYIDDNGVTQTIGGSVYLTYAITINGYILGDGWNCAVDKLSMIWDTGEKQYTAYLSDLSLPETAKGNTVIRIASNAFKDCDRIETIRIPKTIKSIGYQAFSGCSSLNTIYLYDGLESINDRAFENCISLSHIISNNVKKYYSPGVGYISVVLNLLPNTLEILGESAFYNCQSLNNITIPKNLVYIQDYAFLGCHLDFLFVDDGNPYYFYIKPMIHTIFYHDGDPYTNPSLFLGSNFSTQEIKPTYLESIYSICKSAFEGCEKLTSMLIAGDIEVISDCAFKDCTGLKSIQFTDGLKEIGYSAFENCTNLKSLLIPSSVTSIISSSFKGCSGLSTIEVDEGNKVYDSRNNCNAIFRSESNTLMKGCKTTVIPFGTEYIDKYAFADCSGLERVDIPYTVKEIRDEAFRNCPDLKEVHIELTTPPDLSDDTFDRNTEAILYVPVGCKAAYQSAKVWKDFKEIRESGNIATPISFADSRVKSLCVAHWDKNGDSELDQSEAAAVTDIGEVFNSNTAITSFDELEYFIGLKNLNAQAFTNCSALTHLILPYTLESIGDNAFSNCTALTKVIIPQAVSSIGTHVFMNCPSLSSLSVEDGNAFYDSRDNCCAIIKKAGDELVIGTPFTVIPTTVTTIGANAFENCSIESIHIPASVIDVKENAFKGCRWLHTVRIMENLKTIGMGAFKECDRLVSFQVSSIKSDCSIINANINFPSCTLYVPINSSSYYQGHPIWSQFKEIIETSFTGFDCIVFADSNTKSACINQYDTNGDGELSTGEAAVVTELTFSETELSKMTTFDELLYFTSLKTIPDEFFKGCNKLTAITIPISVSTIGQSAFQDCVSITSFAIPNSVTTIGALALNGCTSISTITIPSSVTSIGGGAFSSCSSLSVDNGNTVYDSRMNSNAIINRKTNELVVGCANTVIPTTVTSIGEYAFWGCNGLTHIVIPDEVTSIGKEAFYNSSLCTVIIGSSVSFIGKKAFYQCRDLKCVKAKGTTPAVLDKSPNEEEMVFPAIYVDGHLKDNLCVPEGCRDLYISSGWTRFNKILSKTTFTNLDFADQTAKDICVTHWDKDEDGGIDVDELKVVTSISESSNRYFANTDITSFDEFQYFTGMTELKGAVFQGCQKMKHITLPNTITKIWVNTFDYCTSLTDIVIPTTVTSIANNAFSNCSSLQSISLPNSLLSIGDYAFRYCSSLKNILIPPNVTSIGSLCFSNCGALTWVIVDKDNTCYDSRNNCNAIIETATNKLLFGCKNTIIPKDIITIGSYSFSDCKDLQSIIIPEGVTSINDNAFLGTGLTSIMIPKSVTFIGSYAFSCRDLTTVIMGMTSPIDMKSDAFPYRENATLIVPAGCRDAYRMHSYYRGFKEIIESSNINFADATVEAICVANWDFNGDGELSEIEAMSVTDLGEVFKSNQDIISFDELQFFTGLTNIGEEAFSRCYNLKSIVIPNSVTKIGSMAFWCCYKLSSINIPDKVTSIDMSAFTYCQSLVSIHIPNNVETLADGAFSNCTGLKSLELPNSITYIGKELLCGCTGIISLAIPCNVKTIGTRIISGCSNLTTLFVDDANELYDSRNNCNAIIETETNTLICGCMNTIIPSSVEQIGTMAFWGCTGLSSITIPENVSSIGGGAFYGCSNLTIVKIERPTPLYINSLTFTNRKNATLYVPAGCKAAYEAAQYWQDFKEIKEIGGSELIPLTVGVEDVTVRLGSFIEDRPALSFDFENDETMWGWGNDQEMGIAEGSYNGTKYQTTTNPRQVEFWENQIAMGFSQLVPGEVYVLEFWAKSDKSFWLNANLQYPSEEAGWPSRGDFDWVEIGTEWQKFTMTTTVTGPNATQLVINIGELDGGTFCLDDISLRRKNPLFKLTYEGFVDGDDETTAFTTLPVASTTATNNSPVGTYPITVSGGVSEKYSITYRPGTLTIVAPIKGDANNDGVVDMKDVVAVVNCLLGITSETFDKQNADMNNDGYITITDAVAIVMGLQ